MRNIVAWLGMLLLVLAQTGCGSDSKDLYVTKTLSQVGEATATMGSIRDSVTKTLKKVEKDKLTDKSFDEAIKQAEELKKIGQKMQETRTETERLRSRVTDEERKQLATQNDAKIQDAILALRKEKQAMDEVIQKAEEASRSAVEPLKNKIREAFGAFESLAKQR